MSNFPPGYSEDGDAAQHGRETAIYQELCEARRRFEKWVCAFAKDFPSDDFKAKSDSIEEAFMWMEEDLNQPL